MSSKTLAVEGFYSYNDKALSDSDDGRMEFHMVYDSANSAVDASGSDRGGSFVISGLFDGNNLRWMKRYPATEVQWKYVGKVIKDLGDNSYRFAGTWGDEEKTHGTFVLTAAPTEGVPFIVPGEWSGQYMYAYSPNRLDPPMHVFFTTSHMYVLRGEGSDGVNSFRILGTFLNMSGVKFVRMTKKYADGLSWDYNAQISSDGKSMAGTWGARGTVHGTFTFAKSHSVEPEQSKTEDREKA